MKNIRKEPRRIATRREFLSSGAKSAGLVALGSSAPGFLVNTAHAIGEEATDKDGRILVLIKLGGGNDGLNTLVPVNDRTYYEYRPKLAIPKEEALMISEDHGFNPACTGFQRLFGEGQLAVIQDVGYPNSTRSHFSGQDFYERGGGAEYAGSGWLGRYLDAVIPPDIARKTSSPVATHISRALPIVLRSRRPQPVFSMLSSDVRRLMQRAMAKDETAELLRSTIQAADNEKNDKVDYLNIAYMNALITEEKVRTVIGNYKADANYPKSNLASDMRAVAAMISAGMGTRIYSLDTGGFDTHSNQLNRHAQLVGGISGAISSFLADLEAKKLADKVIVMPFSEFGRRPYENGSAGTDHGTNSVFFVAGGAVKGGLYGNHPSIPKDERSDLKFTKKSIDFRQLYATVLGKWLGADPEPILKGNYKPLDFLG
ncbi:MAG: DUF1501 domain-containing protein [Roseibacillus sp.]|jgi:uncharacterized protein (DUF1501 family)|nr:DUF1501 domain-containing protein [Roseibacillus sp.]MDP6208921.1 DUF1501 domain-containing protein [Roseibacillus sp.]MDP7105495.1 DUF1501 domain-containing protein [Roseibacillus sp.]MDP7307310.1 DUF1501 domain-containing protein [Roseibacillus sp.]MDP7656134.1 DUF1501 domain-containing protein [Roseibacillus sp.]